jgi:hypothetical protein
MAEIRTVTTLQYKREEIEAAIKSYELRLAQARADLAHINAAIAIFKATGDARGLASYVDLHRLFRYGEMTAMCKAALAAGPMSTREIALYVVKKKGLDLDDKVLIKAITHRLIHPLRLQRLKGTIVAVGRYKAALIWRLRD